MNGEIPDDRLLIAKMQAGNAPQEVVDAYYHRCIDAYLGILGIHWHTGFYRQAAGTIGPADQERMNRVIADSVGLGSGDHVLDAGCGVGGPAAYLAREYHCRIRGLTPVAAQRAIAGDIARRMDVAERVTVDIGYAGLLPYDDASFDVVLFFESPCHFPDRRRFFAEAFRVLRPGGRLAGEDWLATAGEDAGGREWIAAVCRDWAIPALGDGPQYIDDMSAAGFVDARFVDMRTEMALQRGFATSSRQRAELLEEANACASPFFGAVLKGLASLGGAVAAGAFTVGRFTARKAPGPAA